MKPYSARLPARALAPFCGIAALIATAASAQARITVDYVVYVGGARIGTMTLAAQVEPGRYQVETRIDTEEVAGATEEGTLTLFAAGTREAARLSPHIFTSDYVSAAGRSAQLQITFNEAGPASVLALPPPARRPAPLADFHRKGALDPVSAVLAAALPAAPAAAPPSALPEAADGASGDGAPDPAAKTPCARTLPVFDGWRRFDLSIAYAGRTEISGSEGYAGPALKCEGRIKPVAGYSAQAMADMRDEPQSVEIWLAPAGRAGFHLPVRIIAPTPFGGAVIRSTAIRED